MYKKPLKDNYARFTVGGHVNLKYVGDDGTKRLMKAEVTSKTGKAIEVEYSYRGKVSTLWLPRVGLQKIVDGNSYSVGRVFKK